MQYQQAVDLQSRINDLISIQALPAIWSGHQSPHIVGTLLEALVRILHLDFAYARVGGPLAGSRIELVRLPQRGVLPASAEQFGRDLWERLGDDLSALPVAVPNPLGQGTVNIARFHFGVQEELGVAIAASSRSDFPTKSEMLLLRVAGNQAAMGLHEARVLNAHRRAADDLEERVAERTAQLTAANQKLSREIIERKRAEAEAVALRNALSAELSAMICLHDLTTRLVGNIELQPILEEVLDAAIFLHGADFGLVQLYNPATRGLEIVAQRGFQKDFLEYFKEVRDDDASACGRCLRRQERVCIEDIEIDIGFAPHRAISAAAGFRAVQSTPLCDRAGKPLGVISTHFRRPHRLTEHDLRLTDLYARYAAEVIEHKGGEDERRKLASLAEASTDFIGIASLEGRVLFVNPEGRKLVGLDGDVETTILDYVSPEDREFLEKTALPAVTRDGRWDGEMRLRHFKTGHLIPMQTRLFFINEPGSGRRVALATISRDITEPKRIEQARQESDQRWRAVYESWAVGIRLSDAAGRIVAANPALQRMLGYTEQELQQLTLTEMIPEEDRHVAQSRVLQLLERRIPEYQAHQRFRHKDGHLVWASTSASLVISVDKTQLIVEIVEDISERKHAEAALVQAQADLARVMRVSSMGELAASIAHEVNQPLAAVVANGSACRRWLAAVPPNMDEASNAADRVVRDATRASEVISRIRSFLRRGELRKASLDIGEVIREAIPLIQIKASTQAVELRIEIAPDTPRVIADRIQLQQVILNLMLNGIEAMDKLSPPRVLQIAAGRHDAGAVRVAVCDSGVGIDAAHRENIFDPFFTTKAEGMGMGLAISRSVIEANQGRLWAAKNEGPGETFQFVLPAAPESAS
jgi:PAS domain S-box-containing protein